MLPIGWGWHWRGTTPGGCTNPDNSLSASRGEPIPESLPRIRCKSRPRGGLGSYSQEGSEGRAVVGLSDRQSDGSRGHCRTGAAPGKSQHSLTFDAHTGGASSFPIPHAAGEPQEPRSRRWPAFSRGGSGISLPRAPIALGIAGAAGSRRRRCRANSSKIAG